MVKQFLCYVYFTIKIFLIKTIFDDNNDDGNEKEYNLMQTK